MYCSICSSETYTWNCIKEIGLDKKNKMAAMSSELKMVNEHNDVMNELNLCI